MTYAQYEVLGARGSIVRNWLGMGVAQLGQLQGGGPCRVRQSAGCNTYGASPAQKPCRGKLIGADCWYICWYMILLVLLKY